ncbi:mevalonate kinase [Lewinella sp. 4G2]|uniref:mevalonate kinase family protein n=1 Tax=Lewinella sp. 4G2 TaxID=1803372 RepID=UPI0007B4944B|nr:hypothetical protein [Lewinella sp. 4G2]OAV43328.1 hypothetical protein A3850_001930 [Lewinella sp. 4G2]
MANKYPAKVLLFGEHTVLRGGRGLAVPYERLSLSWKEDRPDESLLQFCDYLKREVPADILDTNALEDQLLEDWRLIGNIPVGYGLGSSGAVVAAVFDRFATEAGKALRGEALRQQLAQMESYFHGDSSGTDPLICYLRQPTIIGGGEAPRAAELPKGWADNFFLVDTGRSRKASTLIRKFTEAYDGKPDFAELVNNRWKPSADAAITALISGNRAELKKAFTTISEFQLQQMRTFIPKPIRKQWSGEGYRLKICGAGGGGMLLGLADRPGANIRGLGKVMWLGKTASAGR